MSIEVQNISKLYGTQKALDSVSFSVKSGEVVGFLGPNGAGKSTLMKTLMGVINPSEGSAFINGIDVTVNPYAIKAITGYLPEHNPLYLEMYVKEFLMFIGKVHKVHNLTQRVQYLIDQVGIGVECHKKIGMLSKGYRQRIGLAQALIHDPEVLILDEPTTGLDPNQILEIRKLILEVGKTKTILLSTHIMQEVEAICSKVIILSKGKIVANENQDYLKSHTGNGVTTTFVEFIEETNTSVFNGLPGIDLVEKVGRTGWLITSASTIDPRPSIFKMAVSNNLTIITLQLNEKHLEDVFRELTAEN